MALINNETNQYLRVLSNESLISEDTITCRICVYESKDVREEQKSIQPDVEDFIQNIRTAIRKMQKSGVHSEEKAQRLSILKHVRDFYKTYGISLFTNSNMFLHYFNDKAISAYLTDFGFDPGWVHYKTVIPAYQDEKDIPNTNNDVEVNLDTIYPTLKSELEKDGLVISDDL